MSVYVLYVEYIVYTVYIVYIGYILPAIAPCTKSIIFISTCGA